MLDLTPVYRFLNDNWQSILAAVIAGIILVLVVGAYTWFSRRRSKPRFIIETAERDQENKLGFQVQSKNRNIKDAEVFCDSIPQEWEENGKGTRKADLFVGKPPVPFFPYEASLRITSGRMGLGTPTAIESPMITGSMVTAEMTIQERKSKRIVGSSAKVSVAVGTSGKFKDTTDLICFTPKIRLIGAQIEEVKDYPVQLGVEDLVVVGLQTDATHFSYHFEGKLFLVHGKKRWHFW